MEEPFRFPYPDSGAPDISGHDRIGARGGRPLLGNRPELDAS
jgi:hypothetical protein